MQKNQNFGQATEALKKGKKITRMGWNGKNLFVFMQVPSQIDMSIVPKMQSLPQSVKDEFIKRHNSGISSENLNVDPIELNSIKYNNQFAIVYPDNTIYGWAPSQSDILADDWIILD